MLDGEKACSVCKSVKPLAAFALDNRPNHNGRQSRCRQCRSDAYRALKASDHRFLQTQLLKSRFGITRDDWEVMVAEQGGRCAICGQIPHRTLAVDHDHVTGKIRGLLCDSCNNGLGRFRDDPIALRTAAQYLEEHSARR